MTHDDANSKAAGEMDYSQWLASGPGCGAFIVDHAKKALDDVIASERGQEHGAAELIDSMLARFEEIRRQCSRWKAMAAMENLFRAYPGLVDRVGALIEMPMDGCGGFFLRVNGEFYEPGSGDNQFCCDTMQQMEDIDGLAAINLAYDSLMSACGQDHPKDETGGMQELSDDKSQAELQVLMAREAPELQARVQAMWMGKATRPARGAGRAAARM